MWKIPYGFLCGKAVENVGKVLKNSVQRKSLENVDKMWVKNPRKYWVRETFPQFPHPLLLLPLPIYLFSLPLRGEPTSGASFSLPRLSSFLFLEKERGERKKRERKNTQKTKRKGRKKESVKIFRALKTVPAWASVNCLRYRSYNAQNRISRFGTFVEVGAKGDPQKERHQFAL